MAALVRKTVCDTATTRAIIASRGDPRLSAIAEAVFDRRPLTFDQGVYLYRHAPADEVCRLAAWKRQTLHGDRLHYSNAARLDVVDIERQRRPRAGCLRQVHARTSLGDLLCSLLSVSSDNGIDDVVIASRLGAPPVPLPFEWWHNLVAAVHSIAPGARVNACTSRDVVSMAKETSLSVDAILVRLAKSGLTSLGPDQMPACDDTESLGRWLHVHERAHALGISSEATLPNRARNRRCEHRVEQMLALRRAQEKSLARGGAARGFRAVATGTRTLSAIGQASAASRYDDLRDRAIVRLVIDNVDHILVPPLPLFDMPGPMLARVIAAARAGADDLGWVAPDNEDGLRGAVEGAGFSQARRYTRYPFARVGWTAAALEDFYADIEDVDGVGDNGIERNRKCAGQGDRANRDDGKGDVDGDDDDDVDGDGDALVGAGHS
ncbi:Aminodeoxyfutalosine synthase [Pandoravirus neocaledonia]|uniref:Aminodeoxyfutalosine synthase n=1 Tax=Pandoravirus neocaledonia TaxID=2107708 RepID=A0A2U7UD06_9VIRU|nr:Aminodeoxyfutalosine synthase [Pandoravirus neocaledonia]AVK76307.1 Aminodeoxyfutalosine synthase [Pandoravirus neocaledonia]